MDVLVIIAEKYGFKEVSWVRKPEVIMTHLGKRKLSYWRERDLLEYHLNFRDRLFSKYGILCNRMIRTIDHEAFIPIHQGYVSVHDSVEEEFAFEHFPEMEGYLLSSLIDVSVDVNNYDGLATFPYRETLEALRPIKTLYPQPYLLLVRLIPEVKKRLSYNKSISHLSIPISNHSIKEVMGQFYFEISDEEPVPVYEVLPKAMYVWYEKKGQEEFKQCFNALFKEIDSETSHVLIQTIIAPWDWWSCIQSLQYKGVNVNQVMEEFVEKWETMRKITCTVQLSISEGRVSVSE
ncbi:hypothetical protein [Pseudalkalibacillus hwajinpoensis]|uniref:hypothetical protein n=1 Tax=Guptibacillus hwajinpoensis TaxID=208199 RepID=UPI001CD2D229|nr:hypothetical protein [Pseudalkalibacillus hwajinpoensis]MCA0992539.1 hypothetical protein [Pseudalkalibacillus hwajinpoensis]